MWKWGLSTLFTKIGLVVINKYKMDEVDKVLILMDTIEKDPEFETDIRVASVEVQVALLKFKQVLLEKGITKF
jgi:hypothetical protein